MLGNTLRAPELLGNKGIRSETWRKWNKTVEILPSTGLKQYEPNNSWLQNKQIEKGLKDRKDLLIIERVERSSQLAAADWLTLESRARVTKKSGQEWTSFGLEEDLDLYLIPEEALLLLELNCLELTWQGMALSTQQAYSVLLGSDRPECSIDEYRVYSHLVRQGYRLQRFRYKDGTTPHDRNIRSRRSTTLKRKILVHDLPDGFGMTRNCAKAGINPNCIRDSSNVTTVGPNDSGPGQNTASDPKSNHLTHDKMSEESTDCRTSSLPGECTDSESQKTVPICLGANKRGYRTGNAPEDCCSAAECSPNRQSENRGAVCELNGAKKLPSELYDNGVVNLPGPSNVEAKKIVKNRDSKLQIISDETLVGNSKILAKWPGTRIQRNVKWMPKRNADGALNAITKKLNGDSGQIRNIVDNGASLSESETARVTDVPSSFGVVSDVDKSKRRRTETMLEVIEVSDDDIEELPRKMSRTEMLNHFPNIMCETFVMKQIPSRYLPPNVRPQNISNHHYTKWRAMSKGKHDNSNIHEMSPVGTGAARRIPHRNTISCYDSRPAAYVNVVSMSHMNEIPRQAARYYKDSPKGQTTCQQFSDHATSCAAQPSRGMFGEEAHVAVESGISANFTVGHSIWAKSQFLKRGLFHCQNLWTNMSYYHSRQNLVNFIPRSAWDRAQHRNSVGEFAIVTRQGPCNDPRKTGLTPRYPSNNNYSNSSVEIGESTFRIVPGASSWAATKAKWLDEKTITIDDEDYTNGGNPMVDESEVKIVPQPVKPLVGRQNAMSLAQTYKSLQIIKPATSTDFRRSRKVKQRDCYKISYNLYSTAQHFKKAHPGMPMYRVAVFRSDDTPFIQLADVVRLQEDSNGTPVILACTSPTSVTFAKLGIVRIPDLHDCSEP